MPMTCGHDEGSERKAGTQHGSSRQVRAYEKLARAAGLSTAIAVAKTTNRRNIMAALLKP